ncbi:1-deoxy-D-xylulose-5-phosphate reductoisomerase [Candidatus Latescibacterota bacterium]
MKRFIILGSTGSIGRSSLDVVSSNPDHFEVIGLAACSSVDKMCEQIERYRPKAVSMEQPKAAAQVRERVGSITKVYEGAEGMNEMIVSLDDVDGVINGLVGSAGMVPTLTALENGRDVLLANKETMVMAGPIVMETMKKHACRIVPIDSEMSAIYQCLNSDGKEVKRLILTASGGPFADFSLNDLKNVTVEQALNHPTWNMGTKNTIDSATMMNKGLEIIEASYLFGIPGEHIDITIHRTSVSHSLVEYVDGSILTQISKPDMRLAIQYAMTYPHRLASPYGSLDFSKPFSLSFEPPDFERFPCLALAYESLARGGTATAAMNGANEQAVEAFVDSKISFMEIAELTGKVVKEHNFIPDPTIEDLIATDKDVKRRIEEMIK